MHHEGVFYKWSIFRGGFITTNKDWDLIGLFLFNDLMEISFNLQLKSRERTDMVMDTAARQKENQNTKTMVKSSLYFLFDQLNRVNLQYCQDSFTRDSWMSWPPAF